MAVTDTEFDRSSGSVDKSHRWAELLDRAVHGDRVASGQLIAGLFGRLDLLVRRMFDGDDRLRRWEDSDDVLQLAAFRLHRSLEDARPASLDEFFGLAVTQIRRTLIDLARHHYGPCGMAANLESDCDAIQAGQQLSASLERSRPPDSLEGWTAFHQAVGAMGAEEQKVFGLVWYGGLTQQYVSELLHVSVPTVKRRWRRARLQLYEALGGQSPESWG